MISSTGVIIRGGGIAALSCAKLLTKANFPVTIDRTERVTVPTIMLSDLAVGLIRDVFQQPDAFAGANRITKRVVLWGEGAPPVELPHSAIVISEETLLNTLQFDQPIDEGTAAHWTIWSSRPLPRGAIENGFGSRRATAAQVRLHPTVDPSTCWVESLACGWLFLIPSSNSDAWLLSIGNKLEILLPQSKLVVNQIARIESTAADFPAYPRILAPLCASDWFACGSAAVAFDPICGDGTANAIREAILLSAAIRAIHGGEPVEDILAHYQARLTIGFQKHLAMCRDFYTTGGSGKWWSNEVEALRHGFSWCQSQMDRHTGYKYRLDGDDLVRINR